MVISVLCLIHKRLMIQLLEVKEEYCRRDSKTELSSYKLLKIFENVRTSFLAVSLGSIIF